MRELSIDGVCGAPRIRQRDHRDIPARMAGEQPNHHRSHEGLSRLRSNDSVQRTSLNCDIFRASRSCLQTARPAGTLTLGCLPLHHGVSLRRGRYPQLADVRATDARVRSHRRWARPMAVDAEASARCCLFGTSREACSRTQTVFVDFVVSSGDMHKNLVIEPPQETLEVLLIDY